MSENCREGHLQSVLSYQRLNTFFNRSEIRISEKHFQHDHETKAIWYSYPPDPILSVNYQQIIISTGKHGGGEKCEAGDIMYYEKNYKGSLTTKSELTVTSNIYLWKTETCQTLYKLHINGGWTGQGDH